MSRVLPFIEPQLPTLVDQPPEGADWVHELKHDGYRTLLAISRGTAVAYTRNGHDWTECYPGIVAAAAKLPCKSAMLDGEVIVQDARGASDFEALQSALRQRGTPLIFYAFDLLHLDGWCPGAVRREQAGRAATVARSRCSSAAASSGN